MPLLRYNRCIEDALNYANFHSFGYPTGLVPVVVRDEAHRPVSYLLAKEKSGKFSVFNFGENGHGIKQWHIGEEGEDSYKLSISSGLMNIQEKIQALPAFLTLTFTREEQEEIIFAEALAGCEAINTGIDENDDHKLGMYMSFGVSNRKYLIVIRKYAWEEFEEYSRQERVVLS